MQKNEQFSVVKRKDDRSQSDHYEIVLLPFHTKNMKHERDI